MISSSSCKDAELSMIINAFKTDTEFVYAMSDPYKAYIAKSILREAVQSQFTERQRDCYILTKLDRLQSRQAAEVLNISPSTVCRHLKSAEIKLNVAFSYIHCVIKALRELDNSSC